MGRVSCACAPSRESGFSLPELMIAMAITISLMGIVFGVMRSNQNVFATETGVEMLSPFPLEL